MLKGNLFPRVGAYAVLALGFWLIYQALERSNIFTGIIGGLLIIVGMYLMTGVWREMFDRFGGPSKGGPPKIRRKIISSDTTPAEQNERSHNGENGDTPQ